MTEPRIIRGTEPWAGLETRALAIDWGMRTTCYVKDCEEPISTIIRGEHHYALCEAHYQQGNVPGGTTLSIVL